MIMMMMMMITRCPMVSAVSVQTVTSAHAHKKPQHLGLTYLDLSDCPHVDDTSLRLVVESCPQVIILHPV